MNRSRRQAGFAYIAAVVLLVVVAGLAVALLRLSSTQQATVNQALLGARASLAARGGIEWAFHVLNTRCQQAPAAPVPVDLTEFQAESGFHVTVTCSYTTYFEASAYAYRVRAAIPSRSPIHWPSASTGSAPSPAMAQAAVARTRTAPQAQAMWNARGWPPSAWSWARATT